MTLRGHEDLKPKAIVGFDMGFALVDCGGEVKRYRLAVGAMGNLMAAPVDEAALNGVDQLGSLTDPGLRAPRRHTTVDQRM
jgi:hypothetical protein